MRYSVIIRIGKQDNGLLLPVNVLSFDQNQVYELYFVFAAVWAFGGSLISEGLVNYKQAFSKWWRMEWRSIKFPPRLVFAVNFVVTQYPSGVSLFN
mgnify:CR=1 FL=1